MDVTTLSAAELANVLEMGTYELRAPEPQITSLAENEPMAFMLPPVEREVVYRTGAEA